MRTKYLILDNVGTMGSTDGPIIVPEFETHNRVAQKYGGREHVVSAGFVQIYVDDGKLMVACFGESDSLGIKSREDIDASMIRRMFVEYD